MDDATRRQFDAIVAPIRDDLAGAVDRVARESAPVLSGMQCQGDIQIRPIEAFPMPYYIQPMLDGAVVALIEDGNGHQMSVDLREHGAVLWFPHPESTRLGYLQVIAPAVVYVEQVKGADAHLPLAVGHGVYRVGRQMQSPPTRRPLFRFRRPN